MISRKKKFRYLPLLMTAILLTACGQNQVMDGDGIQANAEYSVENKNIFFWEDGNGKHVASCTYRPNGNGEMALMGLVYTREEARRKQYAGNLVYQITQKSKDEGYMPMLYTNADYVASNACYEKLGYKLRGKLCSIGV